MTPKELRELADWADKMRKTPRFIIGDSDVDVEFGDWYGRTSFRIEFPDDNIIKFHVPNFCTQQEFNKKLEEALNDERG